MKTEHWEWLIVSAVLRGAVRWWKCRPFWRTRSPSYYVCTESGLLDMYCKLEDASIKIPVLFKPESIPHPFFALDVVTVGVTSRNKEVRWSSQSWRRQSTNPLPCSGSNDYCTIIHKRNTPYHCMALKHVKLRTLLSLNWSKTESKSERPCPDLRREYEKDCLW